MTSYYLIFRRDPKLSIKEVMLTYKTMLKRIIELIHKVSIFRKSAKVAINKIQQKMKTNYQMQQIKEFVVEDQVLYNDNPKYYTKL